MELLPWAFGRQMVSCFLGNSLVRFSDVSEKRYRRYSEHIALPGVKWSENNASAQDIVRCFGMFHAAPASLLLLLLEPGVHRQMTRAVNVLLPVGAAAEDLRAVLVLGLGPALAKAILEKCASLHSRACVFPIHFQPRALQHHTGTGCLGEIPLAVCSGPFPSPLGSTAPLSIL